MIFGQGRTEGCHNFFKFMHFQCQGVCVSLHDHHSARFPDLLNGRVESEQQLPFVKDRCFGGVQVLWQGTVQDPAAESDHLLPQVFDRKDDPPAEPVIIPVLFIRDDHSGLLGSL